MAPSPPLPPNLRFCFTDWSSLEGGVCCTEQLRLGGLGSSPLAI